MEVKAGFVTSTGCCGEYPEWYSAYFYCRRWVDEDDNEDEDNGNNNSDKDNDTQDTLNLQDWAWRVIFLEASVENPRILCGCKLYSRVSGLVQ